jgi:ABC-type cobalamin/Fe3+-siderophores transport system ATPase subunit
VPIQKLVVTLFGTLRHEIPMHPEGLTFMFGLNGSGKTMTLHLLDSLFNQRFSAVLRVPFGELEVVLSTEETLVVTRENLAEDPSVRDFVLRFSMVGKESWTFARPRGPRAASVAWVSRHYPQLRRVNPRLWLDTTSGRRLSLDEIASEFDDVPFGFVGQSEAPDWLLTFLSEESTYFIRADRLHSNSDGRKAGEDLANTEEAPQTVEGFAQDLAEKLNVALADYGEFSQSRESSFPQRFLGARRDESVEELRETVENRHREQSKVRARYVKAGLLEPGEDFDLPDNFDADRLQFLAAYLDDVDAKLEQLSVIAAKLELFLEIINTKLRRKQIVVDRRVGFRVEGPNERIGLSALSSGEQQEIVLTYGLLFRENPGTLVLIDEPELSLHVAWQFQLVPDFLQIAKLAGLTFLIATHSPQVVNGQNDITVYLNDEGDQR